MMKKILLISLLFLSVPAFAQTGKVNWLTFEQAIERNKTNPKTILVDMYTDWCGWCKKMDKETYSNKVIADYINKHFHPVKFNAEQKEDVVFKGHTFKFVPNGRRGYHELAASLMDGKMSYPTTILLNSEVELMQRIPGYLNKPTMEKILNYIVSKAYKTTPWAEYEKNFQSQL